MDMTAYPIYLVGGSKGGVGKSLVALALADYVLRRDIHAALVERPLPLPSLSEILCSRHNMYPKEHVCQANQKQGLRPRLSCPRFQRSSS
ncbi:hypothetical protein ACLFKU_38895, partial [Paraburkholderia sp. EG304]